MKKWNAPEVSELNINETASGGANSVTEQMVIDGAPDGVTYNDAFLSAFTS